MTPRRGFGLYVHWPFCQAKCPYCDFNSHLAANVDQDVWATAFEAEIRRVCQDMPDATLTSIFFGGGTPSLMHPKTVDRILRAARAVWPVSNTVEITLEANPTSVETSRFSAYADLGVNRVSIGVQSLRDDHLARLGRLHSAGEARKAVELATRTFDRVSFDLIYARQDQSLAAWEEELSEALALSAGHLSLYQLTIEPGTAFGDRYDRGRLTGLPDEGLSADMYDLTQDMTAGAGLPVYEVSNHAVEGAESQHNLIYWRGHDWIGVGPGAHGRFTRDGVRIATETHLAPGAWLAAVNDGNGECSRQSLADEAAREEKLMMGLRLTEGLPLVEFEDYLYEINRLVDITMLEIKGDRFRATPAGRKVLNAVLRELLA